MTEHGSPRGSPRGLALGQLEGGLDIYVDIDDGVVVNARAHADMFGGFARALQGRSPLSGLALTPRAYAICAAAHQSCAAWALDVAYDATLPANAILARNLGQIVEILQSIPRYFYGMYAADLCHPKYASSALYDDVCQRFSPTPDGGYTAGMRAAASLTAVYRVLGGAWPLLSYMVPGGVSCEPTKDMLTQAWDGLEAFRRGWLEPCWLGCSLEQYEEIQCYEQLMAWTEERAAEGASDLALYWQAGLAYGLDTYGAGCGRYVSWGCLPHEEQYQRPAFDDRQGAVIVRSGLYDGHADTHLQLSEVWRQELPALAVAEHPGDGKRDDGVHFQRIQQAELGRCEAGPLARQLVSGAAEAASWQRCDPLILSAYRAMGRASLHLRQLARVHELVVLYREAERCLRRLDLAQPFLGQHKAQDGVGWGVTEAARGALAHRIEVQGARIASYQLMAPTTWNVGHGQAMSEAGESLRGPIEHALIGTPIRDRLDPVEVGHVARSFDACLDCTIRAYDAHSGEELACFRTT